MISFPGMCEIVIVYITPRNYCLFKVKNWAYVILGTFRFAFFALNVTCNVWESHVHDCKSHVSRSSYI